MASINDVARQAGVSVTTVSKVLNDYTDVSDKTRIKVREAIQLLRYQPNVVARGLVKKRSWTVGIFLTIPFTNPFVSELLQGMRRSLENSGYDLVYLSTKFNNPNYSFINHCLSRNVDGVVVFGVNRNDPNLSDLIKEEIPTIFVDTDLIGRRAGYITADNKNGIFLGVDHLYKLEHRKIAFISGSLGNAVGQSRFEGYQLGLRTFSLPYFTNYVEIGNYSLEGAHQAMGRLLGLADQPTAVICTSDIMAFGAINAIQEYGLRVPNDISVVGFDNTFYAGIFKPSLTTINQNIPSIGTRAVEHLIAMIENPDYSPPVIVEPVDLVIRDSTAPLSRH